MRWIRANADGIAATFAFLAMACGLWMAWQPLGLIVPGSFVLTALVVKHLRGK